jgi:hypothetical protein
MMEGENPMKRYTLIFVLLAAMLAVTMLPASADPPRRFLNGISSVSSDNPLGQLPYLDPTTWAIHFDDFLVYDTAQGTTYYTFTQTNTADAVVGPSGVVTLTTSGNDNDLGQLQATSGAWQTTSGKKMLFETRVYLALGAGTVAQTEFIAGMTSVQTGANFTAADGSARTFDDGMAFVSIDGSASVDCLMCENDVCSTEAACWTMAADTWYVLSIYHNGSTSYFYVNDALVATMTTVKPTSVISPVLFVKEGEAQTRTLSIDYILAAVER